MKTRRRIPSCLTLDNGHSSSFRQQTANKTNAGTPANIFCCCAVGSSP
jgi:hypothetical protein